MGADGLGSVTADSGLPGLEWAMSLGSLRTHRPGKRAVVETSCGTCFVKVVAPARTARVAARYVRLARVPAVPDVIVTDDELGVIVLDRRPGTTLRDAITRGDALPPADALVDALRPLWARDVVHGDFNDANVLVAGGRVAGLVDLDRSGPGDPQDDLATLVAHLHALAVYRPQEEARIARYRDGLRAAFNGRFGDIDGRIAGVLDRLAQRADELGKPREAARCRAVAARTRNEAALAGPPRGRELSRSADALGDLPRLDAARAHVDPLGGTVDERAHALDVGIPTSLGATVAVADAVAEGGVLAAHLAHGCHDAHLYESETGNRTRLASAPHD